MSIGYFRPDTLEAALAIRAARDVTVLAGGTDVYPARATRAGWGQMRHKDVLDISAVPGLDAIEDRGDHVRLGAMVTWSDLVAADLPHCFAGYKDAARAVGGRQVQNRGTLVGNICTASPAGDGIPNLLVLDAAVEIAGPRGVRRLPMAAFIEGYRRTACAADEIVTALIVPKPGLARSAFRKLGARDYLVISIAMAAGLVVADTAGRITGCRIAVGACSAVAQRLPALEAALLGRALADDLAGCVDPEQFARLEPIDDVRASGDYRRAAAVTLVRDLVADLAAASLERAA